LQRGESLGMDFLTIVLCRDGRQLDLGRIHRRDHDCGALPGASQTQFSVDTHNAIEVVLTSGQKIEFDHGVSLTVQRPNKLRSDRKRDLVRGPSTTTARR
jgi:hypothetical protein